MSESRKSKKRHKKHAKSKAGAVPPANSGPGGKSAVSVTSASTTETLEETLFWYNGGSDEKSQNLMALKLEVLGPLLFSYNVLSREAKKVAVSLGLLPDDSTALPMFFEKSQWHQVVQMSEVMSAVVRLCEKDEHAYKDLLGGVAMEPETLPNKLKNHCPSKHLMNISDMRIVRLYEFIKAQGASYGIKAKENTNYAANFFRSILGKTKLVDPVKDRGNSNFKQVRFKAAIADYSTAIKISAFSPVLYCNRALCYLRNEDFWNACIDSYRALILYPTWEKPYYRCAEAWHRLGELSHAIDINELGQVLASSSGELHSQHCHFTGVDYNKPSKSLNLEESKQKSTQAKAIEKDGREKGRSASKAKLATGKLEYTEFEDLYYPELDARLTCAELRKLCNSVKLEWCSPASYFSAAGHLSRWEELEPEWVVPLPPATDPLAEREPMMAKFDEIWCPLLADVEESLTIIPPTFQYFSDGTIMHSAVH